MHEQNFATQFIRSIPVISNKQNENILECRKPTVRDPRQRDETIPRPPRSRRPPPNRNQRKSLYLDNLITGRTRPQPRPNASTWGLPLTSQWPFRPSPAGSGEVSSSDPIGRRRDGRRRLLSASPAQWSL